MNLQDDMLTKSYSHFYQTFVTTKYGQTILIEVDYTVSYRRDPEVEDTKDIEVKFGSFIIEVYHVNPETKEPLTNQPIETCSTNSLSIMKRKYEMLVDMWTNWDKPVKFQDRKVSYIYEYLFYE